ncbi:hypothetical protein N474_19820 [Pseudoalteromonas luteoviolacea CPMOR-2]|uniref:DUF962 domain-containing protein n=1 Tax=Pseudoalteromonas luteoviolacea DSM 6061 TaxID=1365250 RepID=A0A161ZSK3_9GAMM|nr:Mpo1-like protein [Pseudoalteromonas luteoviolacea]KZN30836.1 hypothetical protein N475_24200 [Pseudoalteromonas luteoviolacea DSM 6061]KZN53583.1 hypothetical protein N474_19820 [Pseudoalteromonas luteoviolacea CPMOR-2]
MRSLEQQLVQYAMYHRDNRNIKTHLIGVPLIVFAVIILTYIPLVEMSGLTITLTMLLVILAGGYYLILSPAIGLMMILLLTSGYMGAEAIYQSMSVHDLSSWFFYGMGGGLFVIGWIIQFIGHYFEGKKPAFVDDLIGLLIGPLFVLTEVLFKLGLLKGLESKIIEQAGAYRN